MTEATHLTCTVWSKDFDAHCRLFGPEGFGFPIVREFGQPGGLRGKYHQTGAGFIEVVEDPSSPAAWWDIVFSVDDLDGWRQRLIDKGYAVGDVGEQGGNRQGFTAETPGVVKMRIRNLAGAGDAPLEYGKNADGPNVIHYIITWWPEDWERDYAFLSDGLGLVTSRGRNEAGRNIAFLRGAYGGRGIVEVIDRKNSPFAADGAHWRLSLMVDDVRAFHDRLTKAGFAPSDIVKMPAGFDAFNVSADGKEPTVYVAEIPEGSMAGLLGEPVGLSM